MLIALRKDNLWPVWARIETYKEDDLFDVIEFLFDKASKPIDGCTFIVMPGVECTTPRLAAMMDGLNIAPL